MQAVGRWLAGVALVVAGVIGILHMLVPASRTADEGAADPILSIRRPIVKALIWARVLHGPRFMGDRYPYLPTVGGSEWFTRGPQGEDVATAKMEVKKEPVYRGLFWLVGHRITYRLTNFFDGSTDKWRTLRLCYAEGDRDFVAGENLSPDPEGRLLEVSGFVPWSARGYWIEGADEKGARHSLNAWGDYDPFWRD